MNDIYQNTKYRWIKFTYNGCVQKCTKYIAEYYDYNEESGMLEQKHTYDYKKICSDTLVLDGGFYGVCEKVAVEEPIIVNSDSTIILFDTATLAANSGIYVTDGCSLTVTGQKNNMGYLNVSGNENGDAGIGCYGNSHVKNIIINGGDIKVNGSAFAPGIGPSKEGSIERIMLNGGIVSATGGKYAPGIGSGYNATATQTEIGDVCLKSKAGELAGCFTPYEQEECNIIFNNQNLSLTFVNGSEKSKSYSVNEYLANQKELNKYPRVTVYNFKANDIITVTFVVDNETQAVKAVDLFDTIDNKVNLIRLNVTIEEWYTDEDCTIPYNFDEEITHSLTLYAKMPNTNNDNPKNNTTIKTIISISCGVVVLAGIGVLVYSVRKKKK